MSLDGQIQALVTRIQAEFNKDRSERTNSGFVNSVATTNVALTGLQTIGGVAIGAGGRVLLIGQTDPKENGVWIVGSGAWARALDANTSARLAGYVATVAQGPSIGKVYRTAFTSAHVLGVNSVLWYRVGVEMVGSPLNFPVPAADGQLLFDKNSRMPTYWDAAGVQWLTGNGTIQDTRANRLAFLVPAKGLIWRETDTGETYQWDGAAWQAFGSLGQYMHFCRVRKSAAQAITAGTTVNLSWDIEDADTSSMWNLLSPTEVTIPETGRYMIIAKSNISASGGLGMMSVFINGTWTSVLWRGLTTNTVSVPTEFQGQVALDLVSGDKITIGQFSSTAQNVYVASPVYYPELIVYRMPQTPAAWLPEMATVRPAAMMIQTVAQNFPTSGTPAKLTMDAVSFDTDNMCDLVNERMVIQTAGLYRVTVSSTWVANVTGFRQSAIRVNGVERAVGRQMTVTGAVGTYGVTATHLLSLDIGDYIEGWGLQSSGGALATIPGTNGGPNDGFVSIQIEMVSG